MEIRKATQLDLDKIITNRIDFVSGFCNGNLPDGFAENTNFSIKKLFSEGKVIIWLAVDNDNIVSNAILNVYDTLPTRSNASGKVGLVLNVWTNEKFRRQGLATKLLNNIFNNAKELGIGRIQLTATEQGKFVYEKLGFEYLPNEMAIKID